MVSFNEKRSFFGVYLPGYFKDKMPEMAKSSCLKAGTLIILIKLIFTGFILWISVTSVSSAFVMYANKKGMLI